MSFVGATDVPIEIIGGLVCDMAASELPAGVSPDCQDVAFGESSVRTRPGLGAPIAGTPLTGNVVNYLKTFITSNGTLRALAMTDLANLYKETAPGTFGLVSALNDVNVAAPYANSTTIFNREYFAFSDGKYGVGMPRQFDDVNLDRVSQVGPGAGPVLAEEAPYNMTSSVSGTSGTVPAVVSQFGAAVAITSISQSGNLVTVVPSSFPFAMFNGESVTIAGVTPSGYNGTFPVQWVPSGRPTASAVAFNSPTAFTYVLPASGLAAGAGGTAVSNAAAFALALPTFRYFFGNFNGYIAQFPAGLSITVAGVVIAGYNGTWTTIGLMLWSTPCGGFTCYGPAVVANITSSALANSSGGTVTVNGNIPAGVHECSVIFVTRQGYLTMPSPPVSWTSTGKRVVASGIAVGPPNVVQRILSFTAAGGSSFFYVTGASATLLGSEMVITDNTSTTAIINFTDAILLAGTNVDALFNQVELGECAGVIDYKLRNFWWGERNKVPNFVNLTFDGGFSSGSPGPLPHFPLGWTPDPTFSPGGAQASVQGDPVIWGDAYSIVGNGGTATRGLITQGAQKDYRGVPIIQANTGYSVRARIGRNNTLAQGTMHVHLQSTSLGIDAGLDVTAAQATPSYQEFTAVLTAGIATPPIDLQIKVYADGTPTLNGDFFIDNIEIYPTAQPNNPTLVRASRAQNPESFDGVMGLLSVAENNGQAVRSAFKLRERLYFVKEDSLYSTADDAASEPSGWSVDEVSRTVGTPSVRGVGFGPDWVAIAHRAGLYIFAGGEPHKISQEVGHSDKNLTLAWDQINWQFGHTIWVTVDTLEKRILVGAPFGAATSPNAILQMDYREIDPATADNIAAEGPIRLRYTGIMAVMAKSRKWSPWTPSINSCALIKRTDLTEHLWMGAGSGVPGADRGAIYDVQRSNLTDYSTQQTIPSYYWTAFMPQREQNQIAQVHEHRKYFPYLTMFVEGSGFVNMSAAPNQFGTYLQQRLPSLVMYDPSPYDLEMPIDVEGERIAFKVSNSGAGSWFRLQKLTPSMMSSPHAPVRGSN